MLLELPIFLPHPSSIFLKHPTTSTTYTNFTTIIKLTSSITPLTSTTTSSIPPSFINISFLFHQLSTSPPIPSRTTFSSIQSPLHLPTLSSSYHILPTSVLILTVKSNDNLAWHYC